MKLKLDDKMLVYYLLQQMDSPEVLQYAIRENKSIIEDIKERLKKSIKSEQDKISSATYNLMENVS